VISSEPGIGKTTLASELTGWIKRQDGTTASMACYAPETNLSLVPVVSWLRAISLTHLDSLWQAELARALPELITGHSQQTAPQNKNEVRREALAEPWQKRRFYEAMARAVLSQQGPICLHIEDIQWADSETLSWLHYLLRLEQTAHLMVIATLRLEQTSSVHLIQLMLSTWRQQGRLAEIELPPLDEATTAALAASMLGEDLPAEISTTLYRQPCSLAQGRTGLAATL
jgi:predicted ATPase